MQPSNDSGTRISNSSIIIAAVSCLIALIFVIGIAMLVAVLTKAPVAPKVEEAASVPEESEKSLDRTYFQEGYSMVLPPEFRQESREETERGYIVYRFRSDDGCRFTFAIIPDDSIDRFTNPPSEYSQTLVKSVRELSQGIDGEVDALRVWVDGMSASLFRFYEKETFRGVNFTHCMVAMDRGRKLVLKFAGKYGGHSEREEFIEMPEHWYDALLTLRHIRREEEPNATRQPEQEKIGPPTEASSSLQ